MSKGLGARESKQVTVPRNKPMKKSLTDSIDRLHSQPASRSPLDSPPPRPLLRITDLRRNQRKAAPSGKSTMGPCMPTFRSEFSEHHHLFPTRHCATRVFPHPLPKSETPLAAVDFVPAGKIRPVRLPVIKSGVRPVPATTGVATLY